MAVTQYIGARYVPTFADPAEWINTRTYEPLTIVLHEGNSYASRQFVPAGIDITNENYWLETGNYNAQVEQYRTEVRAFDGRISAVKEGLDDVQENLSTGLANVREDMNEGFREVNKAVDDLETRINDDMQIHMLYGNASCTLVQTASKNIVIDTAVPEDAQRISNMFAQYNVKHVDYVIFSHLHADHCTGYAEVFKYCDSSTRVFRGIDLTDANNDNKQYYDDYIAAITSACNALGITLEKASNGQVISLSDVDDAYIQFWNANQSYETVYMNSWKESGDTVPPAAKTASYNDYSLITRVVNGASSYVDCGDIETAAQELNANDMQPATIVKYPHHNANRMGDYHFFDKLACDNYAYSLYNNQLGSQEYAESAFQVGYLYRYLTQCRYADTFVNYKTPVDIVLASGSADVKAGYHINAFAGSKDWEINTTVRGMFPPAVIKTENPNQLYYATLADFANWSKYIKTQNFAYFTSASNFYGTAEFMKDIKAVLGIPADGYINGNIVNYYNGEIEVMRVSSVDRITGCKVYNTFVRNDFPNTGCRLITRNASRTEHSVTGNWARDVSDGAELTNKGVSATFFNNDVIICHIEDNYVPLIRCSKNSYVGTATEPTNNNPWVYHVNIAHRKVYACYKVKAYDSSVHEECSIGAFINPYNEV